MDLRTSLVQHLAQKGRTTRSDYFAQGFLYTFRSWKLSRAETAQPLWATYSNAWLFTIREKVFYLFHPSLEFQLTILSHILPPCPALKGLAPSWWPPCGYQAIAIRCYSSPQSLLFSGLNKTDSPQPLCTPQTFAVTLDKLELSPSIITGAHRGTEENEQSGGSTNLCSLSSESWIWASGQKNTSEGDTIRSAEDHRSPACPGSSPITRTQGSLCWCMVLTWAAHVCSPGPWLSPSPACSHRSVGRQAAASVPSEVTGLQPSSTCPQSLTDPPDTPVSLSSPQRSPRGFPCPLTAAPCLGSTMGRLTTSPLPCNGSGKPWLCCVPSWRLKTAFHYLEGCKSKVQDHW